MKFSLSWLKEHLETDIALHDLDEAMTMAGLEIEDIDNPAEALKDFTVAYVHSAEPHPDADKLRVCQVETKDGMKQIVCGAPNARAGMRAIYAPLGTYIPGLDFALDKKPRKIRGIESHGMMCSSKELNAGEDHDGIADLKEDWAVGTPAAVALGVDNPVIDFEVTPNRPDWLGVFGIARDLAAAGIGTLKTPAHAEPVPGNFPCPIKVHLDYPEACPAYAGRLIKGVKNGPSPAWLKTKLESIGLRSINILVDITNLMTFDRARPLHVYDVARLNGDIHVRRSVGEGDHFDALNDKAYTPSEGMCVIADEEKCLGLGGIIGAENSGSELSTTDVFIECAYFDPTLIRATARELAIDSDAKYRFERGVDPQSVKDGIEWATRLVLDLCGGEASEAVIFGEIPANPADIAFNPSEVKRLTGLDLNEARIIEILSALGFEADTAQTPWVVKVPSWRGDASQSADLVEEIARIHGYDKLPTVSMQRPDGARLTPPATEMQNRVRAARRAIAGRGYQEAITWSFAHEPDAALFGGHGEGLRLANPISSELNVMRPSALIHLIKAVQKSADRGFYDGRFFEAGPIYLDDSPKGQQTVIAGVRAVVKTRDWQGAKAADLFDAKADALAALAAAGAPVDNLQIAAKARDWWHPGRSGVLRLGPKNILAEFGEIHPKVLKALGVDGRMVAFEVFLKGIPAAKKKALKARAPLELSDLMPVRRDFAFLMDKSIPAGELLKAVKGADKALITEVNMFDVYEGQGVPEGHVSLALEVTLQPTDKTLTDKDLEAVSAAIIKVAEKNGASLRG
ncbi:phenylalanine--tRNA ligase subunit beta [Woodsholea maritima]|uniref:phenylalanine--tRNA ligase subunit beta n=1 Tax=Woodsholea maritima TaxID=240237 RepID=UPI0003752A68|nr:phenylalanine--tRNA ligase subunit beta [Woodsholea maritima]